MEEQELMVDRRSQLWLLPWENPMRTRFDRSFFRGIPNAPGVYIMLDRDGNVIYVGKSCRLRERLMQYRSAHPKADSRKVLRLVSTVWDIRYEPCRSDEDACIRENFLLRNFRPRFNVMNTKPFTYFYMTLAVREGQVNWQLTLTPSPDPDVMIFGAFKGRRAAKLAYQALLRLQWACLLQTRKIAALPHQLVVDKAPRDFTMAACPVFHETVFPAVIGYLRGESVDLLAWFDGQLADALAAGMEPFLHNWLSQERDRLQQFFERTLRDHKTMRESLPLNPDIIPQEKVDDLILMHKNARPIDSVE